MSTIQVAARVDGKIKKEATKVSKEYGLNLSDAIKMFVVRIAKEKRIPLRIDRPTVSYDGDSFASDQEYLSQIPGFMDMIDRELDSDKKTWVKYEDLDWE